MDWLNSVEEVLEFKEVPENRKVSLVATRFRGCASAWWQQLKSTRSRQGKDKIATWEKMKKNMRSTFLPPNYSRLIYQQLQNLKQGHRKVTEYTTEFYLLVARCDLGETDEQLVSRYIGGLRIEFQDTLNLLDPFTVAEAQQRALQLEKQITRKTNRGGTWSPSSSSNRGGVNNSTPNRIPIPQVQNVKPHLSEPQTKAQDVGVGRTGIRCFKCGESGHRMADCKKESKVGKGLFIENEENSLQEYADFTQAPVYDGYGEDEDVYEEFVKGDEGPLLVV